MTKNKFRFGQAVLVCLLLLLTHSTSTWSLIRLPAQICDHMVLQQQCKVRLWGWATAGARVKIVPSWSKVKYTTTANDKGRWEVEIQTPEASFTPQTLKIKGDDTQLTLSDVLIGEVWLCSGQSNMEMPLNGFNCQPVEGSNEAIARSGRYRHAIRFVTIPKHGAPTPQDSVAGSWQTCTPETARWFSAVGYFFGRELYEMLHVPVGLINCSWGGSHVEGWMPANLLKRYRDIGAMQPGDPTPQKWDTPAIMYNGMLHPIAGYTVRGVLWNQGESNVGQHQAYPTLFKAMAEHWRSLWGNTALPFYCVEIPPYSYGDVNGTQGALLREAQHEAVRMADHCAIICTNDLAHPWQTEDIHGSRKLEIGQRLAYAAAAREYGLSAISWRSPELDKVSYEGAKAVLSFKYAEGGLSPHEKLEGFEVAGGDGIFRPAQAHEDMGKLIITVTAPQDMGAIQAVRYNFKNFSIGRVHSLSGLPLVPFRTDQ